MPDKPPSTPLSEIAPRFRIPSLLWITTLVAATAAVLGPLLRRFSDRDQGRVVAMWIATIPFAAAWAALLWWNGRRLPKKAGTVRFNLPLVGRFNGETPLRRVGRSMLNAALIGAMLAVYSSMFVGRDDETVWEQVFTCAMLGFMVGRLALSFFPWKIALCDNGVVIASRFTSWEKVRDSQWEPDRLGGCRLRTNAVSQHLREVRVKVAPEDSDSLEKFLRGKTTFINPRVADLQTNSPRSATGG